MGLNSFGQSIVKQLYEYNCDVLAIDKDIDKVEDIVDSATEAIQLDIKDSTELKKLSLELLPTKIFCQNCQKIKLLFQSTLKMEKLQLNF